MPRKTKMSFEFYSRYCVPQVSQTKKHEMATFYCNLFNHIRTQITLPQKNLAPPYKPKQHHQAVISTHFGHTVNLLKNSIHFLLTQLPTGPTGSEPPPNPLCICRFIPFLSQQQLQGCDLNFFLGGKGT